VLVTSLGARSYPTTVIPKLYRDRGDAENSHDELKNQWGWHSFVTQQLAPCRIMANLVALAHNWWNLYVRFFDEHHHREAISSRPALMQSIGRQGQSGGHAPSKSVSHTSIETTSPRW